MGISVAKELEGECLSLLLQVGVVPGSRLEVMEEMAELKQSIVSTRQIEQSSENCRIHIGDYDYSECLYESQLAVLSALDSLWLSGDRELNLFDATAPPHHLQPHTTSRSVSSQFFLFRFILEVVTPFVSLSILSKPDAIRCWVIA
ncbi:unnamed protein product [Linum trigynum]|uniref:Uncharacterized protein n=1 Tax=Linum trigynum TaxID=586398 RepID=A0AAV2DQH7_9ROSI